MTAKTRPGPDNPLTEVDSGTALTNAVLCLSTNPELAPRIKTMAWGWYLGFTGQRAVLNPGDTRLFFEPAFALGRVLRDYLPTTEPDVEEVPCPPQLPQKTSSAPEQRPGFRVRLTDRSTTGSAPVVSPPRSRLKVRAAGSSSA